MTQASSLSPPIPLDYQNTLVLAIELSKTKWVLAAQVPGLLRVKAKQTIERFLDPAKPGYIGGILEIRQPAEYCQHQTPGAGASVGPRFR